MLYNNIKGENMKKIYFLITLLVLSLVGTQVFAVVTTTRKITQTSKTASPAAQSRQNTNVVQTVRPTGNKLADNVMMCKPYSESLNSNIGGVDFNFNVRIEGWVNNKCRLNFVAKSTGINDMFKSLYGVDASQATIMTFEPKIRCDFTKQQLLAVGDSILQEEERNKGAKNNMLKNPSEINISSFGASDAALMNVILNDRACNILNADDSNQMFQDLFSF